MARLRHAWQLLLRQRRRLVLHQPALDLVERGQRPGDRQEPGCTPSYLCGYSSRYVQVDLSVIRLHDGTRYYARMAARFYYGGKLRWDTGWIVNGYWIFPPVFPYL